MVALPATFGLPRTVDPDENLKAANRGAVHILAGWAIERAARGALARSLFSLRCTTATLAAPASRYEPPDPAAQGRRILADSAATENTDVEVVHRYRDHAVAQWRCGQ